MKQAKIWFSENFAFLIFMFGKSVTHTLASGTAKS